MALFHLYQDVCVIERPNLAELISSIQGVKSISCVSCPIYTVADVSSLRRTQSCNARLVSRAQRLHSHLSPEIGKRQRLVRVGRKPLGPMVSALQIESRLGVSDVHVLGRSLRPSTRESRGVHSSCRAEVGTSEFMSLQDRLRSASSAAGLGGQ